MGVQTHTHVFGLCQCWYTGDPLCCENLFIVNDIILYLEHRMISPQDPFNQSTDRSHYVAVEFWKEASIGNLDEEFPCPGGLCVTDRNMIHICAW